MKSPLLEISLLILTICTLIAIFTLAVGVKLNQVDQDSLKYDQERITKLEREMVSSTNAINEVKSNMRIFYVKKK